MSIYYKIYRRRQYVYMAAIFLSVLFTISILSKPTTYEPNEPSRRRGKLSANNNNNDGEGGEQNNPIERPGEKLVAQPNAQRININNYVEPEQCSGCPGENGRGVTLTVSLIFLI